MMPNNSRSSTADEVYRLIEAYGPITVAELAAKIGDPQQVSQLSRVLQSLENAGEITKQGFGIVRYQARNNR